MLDETLRASGFDVIVVECAETAIAILDEFGATLFALVTDIQLGGQTTGWDVARHARSVNDELCIAYMSGNQGGEWASQGVPRSIFVQKPFAAS